MRRRLGLPKFGALRQTGVSQLYFVGRLAKAAGLRDTGELHAMPSARVSIVIVLTV